jgi:penicillin-binding protein 1A
MTSMLQTVNQSGTASKVGGSGLKAPSGGKTGTTNSYVDAWYIGFTKRYTLGVWVGLDENLPMGPGHTGGADALPAWIDAMLKLNENLPVEGFSMPGGVISRQVCNYTGKLAGAYCDASSTCLYTSKSTTTPTETCDGSHSEEAKREGVGMFGTGTASQAASQGAVRRF